MTMAATLKSDPRPAKIRDAALLEFESRYYAAVRTGFHVEPYLSVTDWASANRYLTGAEAGLYSPRRCWYQSEIQDAYNDPLVHEITWMASERIGKSTVASNCLGYIIDREPCGVLWVMPSREAVADFMQDEVMPMLRASPVLSSKVSSGRTSTGRTANIRRRTFAGGVVTFVGAGSASPLAFRTVRVVILDEIDKFKVLPGEGDADALASKRISTYGDDYKILRLSKPGLEGESRIARHYARGSQGRYFMSCPSCGEFQEPAWSRVRFDDVTLRCASCERFNDQDAWQHSPGQWRHAVDNPHHKSFQCSALVSPLIRWPMLIEEFKDAVHALEAGADPSLLQVWENSRMGRTYAGRVDKIDPNELYERREIF